MTDGMVSLTAADGHVLDAWLAPAQGRERGAVVIIQEIFGLTSHIKAVAGQYAGAGFRAIAPAMFDRLGRDITVPHTDIQGGLALARKLKIDETLLDMKAAVDHVRPAGKVAVVGFCWGGTMAYLAAARLEIAAAVSYYGGSISSHLDETLRAPVLFHFGEKDASIPAATIEKIRARHPEQDYYLYPAGHAFNNTDRANHDPPSAALALERSIDFLKTHVG